MLQKNRVACQNRRNRDAHSGQIRVVPGRDCQYHTQWLTPNGQVVRGKGIQPDELISLSPDVIPLSPANAALLDPQALLKSNDAQLVRALEVLNAVAAK